MSRNAEEWTALITIRYTFCLDLAQSVLKIGSALLR